MSISPYYYQWIETTHHEDGSINPTGTIQKSRGIGFMAQEMYSVLPEVVYKPEDESKEHWSIDYGRITPILWKAIQEQENTINSLEEKVLRLEQQINQIEALLSE